MKSNNKTVQLRTFAAVLVPCQVSYSGMDAMVRRFFTESQSMLDDAYADVNLNSTRLDYMWQVSAWSRT